LLGNKIEEDIAWQFTVADLGIKKTTATLKGVLINKPYLTAYANLNAPLTVTFTSALVEDIASLLTISPDRIRVSAITNSLTGGSLLDIQITSTKTDSEDATQLAYEFYSSIFANVFDQQLAYLTNFNLFPAQASKKVFSRLQRTLTRALIPLIHTHAL
jgi:hypothetical protein